MKKKRIVSLLLASTMVTTMFAGVASTHGYKLGADSLTVYHPDGTKGDLGALKLKQGGRDGETFVVVTAPNSGGATSDDKIKAHIADAKFRSVLDGVTGKPFSTSNVDAAKAFKNAVEWLAELRGLVYPEVSGGGRRVATSDVSLLKKVASLSRELITAIYKEYGKSTGNDIGGTGHSASAPLADKNTVTKELLKGKCTNMGDNDYPEAKPGADIAKARVKRALALKKDYFGPAAVFGDENGAGRNFFTCISVGEDVKSSVGSAENSDDVKGLDLYKIVALHGDEIGRPLNVSSEGNGSASRDTYDKCGGGPVGSRMTEVLLANLAQVGAGTAGDKKDYLAVVHTNVTGVAADQNMVKTIGYEYSDQNITNPKHVIMSKDTTDQIANINGWITDIDNFTKSPGGVLDLIQDAMLAADPSKLNDVVFRAAWENLKGFIAIDGMDGAPGGSSGDLEILRAKIASKRGSIDGLSSAAGIAVGSGDGSSGSGNRSARGFITDTKLEIGAWDAPSGNTSAIAQGQAAIDAGGAVNVGPVVGAKVALPAVGLNQDATLMSHINKAKSLLGGIASANTEPSVAGKLVVAREALENEMKDTSCVNAETDIPVGSVFGNTAPLAFGVVGTPGASFINYLTDASALASSKTAKDQLKGFCKWCAFWAFERGADVLEAEEKLNSGLQCNYLGGGSPDENENLRNDYKVELKSVAIDGKDFKNFDNCPFRLNATKLSAAPKDSVTGLALPKNLFAFQVSFPDVINLDKSVAFSGTLVIQSKDGSGKLTPTEIPFSGEALPPEVITPESAGGASQIEVSSKQKLSSDVVGEIRKQGKDQVTFEVTEKGFDEPVVKMGLPANKVNASVTRIDVEENNEVDEHYERKEKDSALAMVNLSVPEGAKTTMNVSLEWLAAKASDSDKADMWTDLKNGQKVTIYIVNPDNADKLDDQKKTSKTEVQASGSDGFVSDDPSKSITGTVKDGYIEFTYDPNKHEYSSDEVFMISTKPLNVQNIDDESKVEEKIKVKNKDKDKDEDDKDDKDEDKDIDSKDIGDEEDGKENKKDVTLTEAEENQAGKDVNAQLPIVGGETDKVGGAVYQNGQGGSGQTEKNAVPNTGANGLAGVAVGLMAVSIIAVAACYKKRN